MPRKPTPYVRPGHNSLDTSKLKELVSRIEAIESEVADLNEDKKAIYLEAKSAGFDAGAIRAVIKMRKQDSSDRSAREALVAEYMSALGDLVGSPLGDYAMAKASAGITPPV